MNPTEKAKANLKPIKKGEVRNPNGRPPKITNAIKRIPPNAQKKIYETLHFALHQPSVEAARKYLEQAASEEVEYGFVLQLAVRALMGKNGWAALNDIMDRLFGKARIITENTVNTGTSGMLIKFDTEGE